MFTEKKATMFEHLLKCYRYKSNARRKALCFSFYCFLCTKSNAGICTSTVFGYKKILTVSSILNRCLEHSKCFFLLLPLTLQS